MTTLSRTSTLRRTITSPPVERRSRVATVPEPQSMYSPITPCTTTLSVALMVMLPPAAVSSSPPETRTPPLMTMVSISTPILLPSVPPVMLMASLASTRPSTQTCERDTMVTSAPMSPL